ncbi:osmotic avoidance abnormal protein 3 isoform X2 [Harpegnathos saltator]|uniref:Kinesin-like protein n=2 Tax=Harpegnathos saltator TaxID=610380 RepID=E2BV46_HARSA|nr:osmotic avoidance abnormal protein 3 isoform X2 [Harpegnathos saltator]XP_025153802.1 osmotic avoidance abnormal protein 3 isoform X2 [Harpegnathos saltator]EFN80436.1 Kinesin-like protein KIF17 [Harpegnathos saltator]
MSESVKVAVRCRPMSNKELQQGCRNVVTIDPLTKSCTLEGSAAAGSGKVYQFDAAFGSSSTTESVYENVGSMIVEAVLEGYNGTVFAYGQTGCGKSFTMRSFIERALEHLFEATSTASSETRYLALLSYLEIYNERLRDLLQDDTGESLTLKEDPTRGTYVAGGLREVTVKDATECTALVQQGDQRRAAAATKMNAASSRSHAVLTLSLEAIAINDDDKRGNAIRRGRLHLVDLAGSERQTRTGATGDRLKEAASINLSLSALGNVISALAAGNGRHVPYRDSKLTRLLRDSLGGNARTLMIACVSPSDVDAEETLSTLRYAARARCIKNKPVVNEDPKDALLRQYQLELQRLRQLLRSSDQSTIGSDSQREADEEADSLREKQYLEEVERLRRECESSNLSAQKLKEELEALKSRHESELNNVGKSGATQENQVLDELDKERAERRRKKREAAMQDVLKRLEKLTIGGEEIDNAELKKRRERRRKRLEALVGALEANDANGSVFQVYGQLRSTEDALKRMAKKVKQLEAEAADLQASWDAERRELLRRELLMSQLCDLMVPQLRPGCPFRDIAAVRAAATWCDELGRWRLPDVTPHIPLPPAAPVSSQRDVLHPTVISPAKADLNNNSNNGNDNDDEIAEEHDDDEDASKTGEGRKFDIADIYFRRRRVDTLLAHAREVKNKNFELGSRLSRSGGSEDAAPIAGGYLQLNALNLQSSAPILGEISSGSYSPSQRRSAIRGGWVDEQLPNRTYNSFGGTAKKHPPRILEALPSYPQGNTSFKSFVGETALKGISEQGLPPRLIRDNDDYGNRHHPFHIGHACSPTY